MLIISKLHHLFNNAQTSSGVLDKEVYSIGAGNPCTYSNNSRRETEGRVDKPRVKFVGQSKRYSHNLVVQIQRLYKEDEGGTSKPRTVTPCDQGRGGGGKIKREIITEEWGALTRFVNGVSEWKGAQKLVGIKS